MELQFSFQLIFTIFFVLVSCVFTQTSTSPEYWFLSSDEITVARNGHPRGNMQTWTVGNTIEDVGGAALFALIYEKISNVRQGDVFRSTNWVAGPNFLLRPDIKEESRFGFVLVNASEQGASVSNMVWYGNPEIFTKLETKFSIAFVNQINTQGENAHAIRDNRAERNRLGSIHQKTYIMKRQDEPLMTCLGGIDIAGGRWDVPGQNTSYPKCQTPEQCSIQKRNLDLRIKSQGNYPGFPAEHGWRDLSLCFAGPATNDVDTSFTNRWNSKSSGSWVEGCEVAPRRWDPIAPLTTSHKIPEGSIAIQILETYLCDYPCVAEFAPRGDLSPMHALIKAISLAEYFVYIEDQYGFLVEELQDALMQFLNREPLGVIIFIIQYPQDSVAFTYFFHQMWHPLYLAYPDRVKAYYRKGGIYLHTKLRIVDDIWAFVGSQNFNRRSYSYDSEIGAAVIDQKNVKSQGRYVSVFVHDMRTRAFEEHTGVPASEWAVMPIVDTIRHLDEIAASAGQPRIGNYATEIFSDNYEGPWWIHGPSGGLIRYVADPDGSCGASSISEFLTDLDGLKKNLTRAVEELSKIEFGSEFFNLVSNILQKLIDGSNLCQIFTPYKNCSQANSVS